MKGKWLDVGWATVAEMNELKLFLLRFPVGFLQSTIIPEMNKHLAPAPNLTIHEFFVLVGCIFFMACHPGVADCDHWWSPKDISPSEGAPFHLNSYMSKNRFREIMGSLCYLSKPLPEYHDKFHDVHKMIDAWNTHMSEEYCPGWWNYLDELMNVCLNPYIPGFMVVPRKPHPYGNEYHSICDEAIDDSDIKMRQSDHVARQASGRKG